MFDLLWPDGVLEGLSKPVAVLLNEADTGPGQQHGIPLFHDMEGFKTYLAKGGSGKIMTP